MGAGALLGDAPGGGRRGGPFTGVEFEGGIFVGGPSDGFAEAVPLGGTLDPSLVGAIAPR